MPEFNSASPADDSLISPFGSGVDDSGHFLIH